MFVLENSKILFLSIFLERVAGAVHHKSDVDVKTDFSEQKKKTDYFTDLKKLLIQYYYVYDNSSFMENFSESIYEEKV